MVDSINTQAAITNVSTNTGISLQRTNAVVANQDTRTFVDPSGGFLRKVGAIAFIASPLLGAAYFLITGGSSTQRPVYKQTHELSESEKEGLEHLIEQIYLANVQLIEERPFLITKTSSHPDTGIALLHPITTESAVTAYTSIKSQAPDAIQRVWRGINGRSISWKENDRWKTLGITEATVLIYTNNGSGLTNFPGLERPIDTDILTIYPIVVTIQSSDKKPVHRQAR